jgi:serine/threonine-protein kinase
MSSDTTHDPPPASLVAGKYELRGLIGQGGMGSVWEGRHTSLGTRVAIKFIDAEYAASEDARGRFDNEARAAATIQSKHAIQIFDHGTTEDGRLYIVMELLEGEPLDKRLARIHILSIADTAHMIRQVGRALARAHEHGIVHRDLKPENIFLVRGPDDDEEVAKVLDFGIAKIKAKAGATGVSSTTKTGMLLGTPFYMSPEQARGLRTVDHRSDLWSLGIIAFRCVTGALPFESESLGDLFVKICTVPVPVPSHVLPGLPAEFDAWMARALDRDPDRRFQSAAELGEALATLAGIRVRRDLSTSGDTPGPGVRLEASPFSPSSRASSVSSPAPGGPLRAPDAAQLTPAAVSAPFTSPRARPMRRSVRIGLFAAAAFALLLGAGVLLFFRYGATEPPSPGTLAAAATGREPPSPIASSGSTPSLPRTPLSSPASPGSLLTAEAARTPVAVSASAPAHGSKPPGKLLPWKLPPHSSLVPAPQPAVPAAP